MQRRRTYCRRSRAGVAAEVSEGGTVRISLTGKRCSLLWSYSTCTPACPGRFRCGASSPVLVREVRHAAQQGESTRGTLTQGSAVPHAPDGSGGKCVDRALHRRAEPITCEAESRVTWASSQVRTWNWEPRPPCRSSSRPDQLPAGRATARFASLRPEEEAPRKNIYDDATLV
jgi:hypothetical protein